MRLIQSLASKELVRNLPKLKFDQHFCDACKIGKQAHASHKARNIVLTTRCLELLHMDLFSPSVVRSYGGNRYTLVIVDDYFRAQLFDKVSDQKDTNKGMSANTKFAKQSILGKPPSSSRPKPYAVPTLPNSTAFPKVGETNALSNPSLQTQYPPSRESTVVKQ
ncbi:hypothetical protein Tco_0557418 [Tanacetum coccineum]